MPISFPNAQETALSFDPTFRIVERLDQLPFKEVTDMIYDSDGQLWIATRSGLYSYDGFHLRPYRCDAQHPYRIAGNEVKRIVEDQQQRIWIASSQGLDRLDKQSDQIEHLHPEGIDVDKVTEMIVTRNGHVWLATESAFVDYNPTTDTYNAIVPPDLQAQGLLPIAQCIFEDHRGFIWLGTWEHGLYRYNPQDGAIVTYPQLNERNSAHVIIEDDLKRIWVAGWSCGVHLLKDAWDVDRVTWQTFTHPDLIGDITYCMTLDADRHQLLIGSSRGLTIADTEHIGTFAKITDPTDGHALPGGEITAIEHSRDGLYWISMIGEGVAAIEPDQIRFGRSIFASSLPHLKVSSVRSIYADRENRLWLGIGTQGLAVRDLSSNKLYNWNEIPALASSHISMSTVYAITETFDNHIWAATFGGELLDIVPPPAGEDIRNLKVTCYRAENSPMTPSARIFCLFEDNNDNLWIGGTGGIVLRHPNGNYERLDSLRVDAQCQMAEIEVRSIDQAADGSIWVAAFHSGVYRLIPQGNNWTVESYTTENNRIDDEEIQSIHIDNQGTIWVGSHYGELYRFDSAQNRFISVKETWHLPGASIAFITSVSSTNTATGTHQLWVGTNVGLLHLLANAELTDAQAILYTQQDGMLDNQLIRNAVTIHPSGDIYFGTYKGYNFFTPSQLTETYNSPIHVVLSQLYIGDTPWQDLPEDVRNDISPLAPRYLKHISLDADQNDFTFEFTHDYSLQHHQARYAYRLEGYDTEWRYTQDNLPRVFYSNMHPGNYVFKICLAFNNAPIDEQSLNEKDILQFSIRISPPWYATIGAKVIYGILGLLALFLIYRGVRSLKTYWRHLLVRARERAALRKGDIIIKANKIEVTDQDKEFINRAIACVESHLADANYDQQQFLDDMGVSKATCFRKLKSITGQSYIQFVRDIKMKAALRMQQSNPNIRISDLAYAVGFSDPKYFSACFKKYYGKLPSESIDEKHNK